MAQVAMDEDDALFGAEEEGGVDALFGEEEEEEEEEVHVLQRSAIGIVICRNCGTSMKPKEERAAKKIYYQCPRRDCAWRDDETDEPCLQRRRLKTSTISKMSSYNPEMRLDPTLSRDEGISCAECSNTTAVMFLAKAGDGTEDNMELVFMCTKCGFKWESATAEGSTR